MFFKKKQANATIDPNNIPAHIGIIMDGNGRWAAKRGLPRSAGHRAGAETLKRIVKYCNKIGVKSITAYAFSTENWNRPQKEVDALMELLYTYLQQVEEQFAGTNVILKVIGDRTPLSDKIKDAILYAEEYTKDNTGIVLNVALNYGGRAEIVEATKLAVANFKNGSVTEEDITEDYMSSLMYTKDVPEVDLIIRPSGELRLSNFLLWQAAYAEFWFDDINWPDFSEKDMERAILAYQKRNRRFGKV
ncbi:MAG: isoprenyl transferase [Clostridia bacterium]|nr:isoprenyl transferase [Clostridia bacterium]